MQHSSDSETSLYTVAAVSRQLGIAPTTLRTWCRRYGLSPSGHVQGQHRRYTQSDVNQLLHMRSLILSGMPVHLAADAVLGGEKPLERPVFQEKICGASEEKKFSLWRRSVNRSLMALDVVSAQNILADICTEYGVVIFWDKIARPLLTKLGNQWEISGVGVELEHTLSYAIKQVLLGHACAADDSCHPAGSVLLACVPDEQHTLPLMVLAAALHERHIRFGFLGAQTPLEALQSAVVRMRPHVVVLWSQCASSGLKAALDAVPVIRPAVRVMVAGPGWGCTELSSNYVRLGSLSQALGAISDAVVTRFSHK